MKSILALALALTACGHVTTFAEDAAKACRGISNPDIRDQCISNYIVTAKAGIDAQWAAIGYGMAVPGGSHRINGR